MRKIYQKIIPRKIPSAALDVGEREIKFVYLDPWHAVPEITTVARYPAPPGVFGEVINEELLVDVLDDMVNEYLLAGTEIISALGGNKVVTRQINLPRMSAKKLNKAVLQEVEKFMPVPLDELFVRHLVLDENAIDNRKELNILIAAAPQATVYQYHALLKRAGLTLVALDLPALAIWRLYRNEHAASDNVIAIFEIGETKTCLVITKKGRMKYTRIFPVGGSLLTRSMSEAYGIDLDSARKLKESEGVIINENDLAGVAADKMRIDLSLRDGLGELLREMRRSLEYYANQFNAEPVDKVILSGGTCNLPGFDVFVSEALGLPAEVARPASLSFAREGEFSFDPSLAMAYGLALREV
ncbi:type IV pilus assembly protein PilM [Desulfotruncus alcoholivorax]|uniref:type IV pilus assembly protein PilM n=1 Tax=Desulfotruncus alcoholivorax TaxID=265477 RepID=UPI0004839D5E|nr:type IV pilus assembly protein PilM [Desulfotruncus alcoholivorax]